MNAYIILRTVALILLPFMFMFGFYVLFHGKISPGGGFQGGAICATAFCLYALIFSVDEAENIIPRPVLKFIACLGCLIYCGTGMLTMALGGRFLDYSVLSSDPHLGYFIGIMTIEFGVQLTVFSALSLIFLKLAGDEA